MALRPHLFLFLEEYVDLGSNERIQQYDESYCGAYCLYMIYLIDRGFRIKSSLNILVSQCKYPGIYNECFCLNCSRGGDKDKDKDKDNDNVNDNDYDSDNDIDNDNQGTCFADDLRRSFANNDNDNDLRSSFANNDNDNDIDRDNFINLFDEKNQRSKYNSNSKSNSPTNSIREQTPSVVNQAVQQSCLVNHEGSSFPNSPVSVNINDDLYSWLNDDDIITEAIYPDNFRCIISGPSECGKTFLLKKLILASIYFDKLYIIGPTGDQHHGIKRINPKADVEFFKDIKDLPSPDNYPKT